MFVIAIDNLEEDRESLARSLASVLDMSLYDALVRLRIPGTGPLVISSQRDEAAAKEISDKLEAAGFRTYMVNEDEIESDEKRAIVHKFSLAESAFKIETKTGKTVTTDYKIVYGIVRGIRIAQTTKTETTKERKLALGRALMTGGLVVTKASRTTLDLTAEEREGFFQLYTAGLQPILFLESALIFDSTGLALQLTRTANFANLLSEMKRRCAAAVYDERLVNKAAQYQLLGPTFDPPRHFDLAVTVLARSLRSS